MHGNNVKYQHPTFSAVVSLKKHHTWAPYPPLTPSFHPMPVQDLGPAIQNDKKVICHYRKIQPPSLG